MTKLQVLADSTFGRRVAEEEGDELAKYFVETDFWRRLYSGEIDIVYGPKGSGKSALYSLLLARTNQLFDREIILISAENPRGAPAFRDLTLDPPTTEREFINLWKLYCACLLCKVFDDFSIDVRGAARLRDALEQESLVPRDRTLASILRSVMDYVRRIARPGAFEAGLELDPVTGSPAGIKGKIVFDEPSPAQAEKGTISVDQLLDGADTALGEFGFSVWILLDRLDVAFAESVVLEENALRALFRVYLDFLRLRHVGLKIFLRTDIWRRITKRGFREGSHVTRHTTLTWDRRNLLYLVVARAVQNAALQQLYSITPSDALRSPEDQERLLYRMCPRQVDVGPNKPATFDWVLGRTRDGAGETAPREVIHFFNALRDGQIRRLEIGESEPENGELFSRPAFKDALVEVSRTRLEQTLYAEYPVLHDRLEQLRGEKTLHNVTTLARIWSVPDAVAASTAGQLVEVGFFEKRGTKDAPEFWIPFLYRDALDLIQGASEGVRESPAIEDDS